MYDSFSRENQYVSCILYLKFRRNVRMFLINVLLTNVQFYARLSNTGYVLLKRSFIMQNMSFNKSNLYCPVHIFDNKNILPFYRYLIFYKKNPILIKKRT